MQLTVTHGEKVFLLTVSAEMQVEELKALCEAETNVPLAEMIILLDGRAVDEGKKLGEAGIKDGDMVLMERRMTR